jgi:hypothetical protein
VARDDADPRRVGVVLPEALGDLWIELAVVYAPSGQQVSVVVKIKR